MNRHPHRSSDLARRSFALGALTFLIAGSSNVWAVPIYTTSEVHVVDGYDPHTEQYYGRSKIECSITPDSAIYHGDITLKELDWNNNEIDDHGPCRAGAWPLRDIGMHRYRAVYTPSDNVYAASASNIITINVVKEDTIIAPKDVWSGTHYAGERLQLGGLVYGKYAPPPDHLSDYVEGDVEIKEGNTTVCPTEIADHNSIRSCLTEAVSAGTHTFTGCDLDLIQARPRLGTQCGQPGSRTAPTWIR